MNKKLVIVIGILAILFIGMATVSFGQENYGYCHRGSYGGYVYVNDELRDADFDDMAEYMENRDYEGMRQWMKNVSDEDFERLIEIMDSRKSEFFPHHRRGIRQ